MVIDSCVRVTDSCTTCDTHQKPEKDKPLSRVFHQSFLFCQCVNSGILVSDFAIRTQAKKRQVVGLNHKVLLASYLRKEGLNTGMRQGTDAATLATNQMMVGRSTGNFVDHAAPSHGTRNNQAYLHQEVQVAVDSSLIDRRRSGANSLEDFLWIGMPNAFTNSIQDHLPLGCDPISTLVQKRRVIDRWLHLSFSLMQLFAIENIITYLVNNILISHETYQSASRKYKRERLPPRGLSGRW